MQLKRSYQAIIVTALISVAAISFADDGSDSTDQVYGDPAAANANLSTPQRLAVLERQMANVNQQGYNAKLADMQNQINQLSGRVDELQHQNQQLSDLLKQQYSDLDQRLTALSTKVGSLNTSDANTADVKKAQTLTQNEQALEQPASKTAAEKIPTPQEQKAYNKGFELLKKQDYVRAVPAFENFLSTYPKAALTANAHFWLAEIHLLQGQYDAAIPEYTKVLEFPGSDKVPMATVKLGIAYAEQGNKVKAKAQFQKVIKNYPNTSAVQLAKQQLKQLPSN